MHDCPTPQRSKRIEWCDRHYRAWLRHGDPLGAKHPWAPRAMQCLACGKPEIAPGKRSYCSSACQEAARRQQQATASGDRTKTEPLENCISCGTPLLTGRVNGRAVHRRTRRFCTDCKSKPRRSYRLAVDILAHYQGTDCGICGEAVDMSVRFPDRACATIDHILPLAMGGTDAVGNLRLAHYSCNCRREDYWGLTAKEAN